jgi:hypothetical protein
MTYHPPMTCPNCGQIIPDENRDGVDVECPNATCPGPIDLAEVVA